MTDLDKIKILLLRTVRVNEEKQVLFLDQNRESMKIDPEKFSDLLEQSYTYWSIHVSEYIADHDSMSDYELDEYLELLDSPPLFYPFTSNIPVHIADSPIRYIDRDAPDTMRIIIDSYVSSFKSVDSVEAKKQPLHANEGDKRKSNKQGEIIRPEEAFWVEVGNYIQLNSKEHYMNKRGNPTQSFVECLSKKSFSGYKKSDKFNKIKIPLSDYKIRELLITYFSENEV